MSNLSVEFHINAPLDRVFAVCTDFENAAENIDAVQRVEILTDGPIGVGTRFRETRIMFKREATETMEITAFDPPHSYTVEADSCGTHWSSTFTFAPDQSSAGGTRINFTMVLSPRSLLAKMLSPLSRLMIGPMRKCVEQDFSDLKAVCERASHTGGAVQEMAAG